MATVLHLQSDLALIKVEDSISSQVLTGVLQGDDHFTCILGNGSYIGIPLDVSCELEV